MKRNTTILELPFKGDWFVLWAGDTIELNQHHNIPNQRYAIDFLIIDKNDISHKGNGVHNDDYYAFDKEILAPADGVITKIIDNIEDNVPGQMNTEEITGNAVLIKHIEGEISVLAHLKQDSIKVKIGDTVKAGQVIGLCGNSGNSTEPHLHYHLQDNESIYSGEGIKCFFQNFSFKNGKTESENEYSPIKGDIISQNRF